MKEAEDREDLNLWEQAVSLRLQQGYGYRMSQSALNMAGMNLRRDLAPRGIAVALLHTGFVKTDMTQGTGNLTPAESASGLLARMAELSRPSTGTFWHADGTVLSW